LEGGLGIEGAKEKCLKVEQGENRLSKDAKRGKKTRGRKRDQSESDLLLVIAQTRKENGRGELTSFNKENWEHE